MKTGDILFARSSTPGGVLIQWLTQSKWNHCGMIVCWHEDKIVRESSTVSVYEAVNPYGVTFTPLERFCSLYYEIGLQEMPELPVENLEILFSQFQHRPFPSLPQLLSSIRKPSIDTIYCSQLVSEIYAHFNQQLDGSYPQKLVTEVKPFYHRDIDEVTPWTGVLIFILFLLVLIFTWFTIPNMERNPFEIWHLEWTAYPEMRKAR